LPPRLTPWPGRPAHPGLTPAFGHRRHRRHRRHLRRGRHLPQRHYL